MNPIYILLIAILFSSCHIGRIKKVPAEIVDISENHKHMDAEEMVAHITVDETNSDFTNSSNEYLVSISEEINITQKRSNSGLVPVFQDMHEVEPDQNDKIVQAMRAERHAVLAHSELLAAFVTSLVAVFFLPMLAVAITLLILGAVQYSRGSRSRYITELGEKKLKTAKRLIILVSISSTLVIAGYTLLFILIFF